MLKLLRWMEDVGGLVMGVSFIALLVAALLVLEVRRYITDPVMYPATEEMMDEGEGARTVRLADQLEGRISTQANEPAETLEDLLEESDASTDEAEEEPPASLLDEELAAEEGTQDASSEVQADQDGDTPETADETETTDGEAPGSSEAASSGSDAVARVEPDAMAEAARSAGEASPERSRREERSIRRSRSREGRRDRGRRDGGADMRNASLAERREARSQRPNVVAARERAAARKCTDHHEGIEQNGERSFLVEPWVVDRYSNLESARRLVVLIRVEETPTRAPGLRLRGLECGNPLHTGGLRDGDIVHSINGRPVRTGPAAYQNYLQLRNQSQVQLVITRDGQTKTFTYRVR